MLLTNIFIFFSVCHCNTISLTLTNAVPQQLRVGTYKKAGKKNQKTLWSSHSQSIWYSPALGEWLVGKTEDSGTTSAGLFTDGKLGFSSCPYDSDASPWKYYNSNNVEKDAKIDDNNWIVDDNNAVSITCTEGNIYTVV